MTRIQELTAQIKQVRADARAEVARLTNELVAARDAFHQEHAEKKQAKAQAKADKKAAKVAKAEYEQTKLAAFIAANSTHVVDTAQLALGI